VKKRREKEWMVICLQEIWSSSFPGLALTPRELFGKDFLCPTVSMHLVTQRKGKVHAVGHKKLEIVFLFFLFHLPEREYEREK